MSSKEEYDGLSAEEREQVDAAALKKEAEEQEGLDIMIRDRDCMLELFRRLFELTLCFQPSPTSGSKPWSTWMCPSKSQRARAERIWLWRSRKSRSRWA